MAASASSVKQRSLLDLPTELWSEIVRLVITSDEPKQIFHRLDTWRNAAEVAQPGIINTCRLMRKAYLHEYYRKTTFFALDYVSLQRHLLRWLLAIGPTNRRHLHLCISQPKLLQRIQDILEQDGDDETNVRLEPVELKGERFDRLMFE